MRAGGDASCHRQLACWMISLHICSHLADCRGGPQLAAWPARRLQEEVPPTLHTRSVLDTARRGWQTVPGPPHLWTRSLVALAGLRECQGKRGLRRRVSRAAAGQPQMWGHRGVTEASAQRSLPGLAGPPPLWGPQSRLPLALLKPSAPAPCRLAGGVLPSPREVLLGPKCQQL